MASNRVIAILVSLLLSCGGAEAAVAAVKPQDAGLLKKLDSPYLRGGLWQASALLTMYPLDTVKTRLQIPFGAPGPYQRSAGAFAVRRVNAMQPPFWSGMGASMVSQLPSMAVMATTFGACRAFLENKAPKLDPLQVDIASMLVGTGVASLWSAPFEAVKCTFQSGMYTSSLKSAVRAIHKESGNRGFFQGYSAQVARDLPFFSLMFAAYEALHDAAPPPAPGKEWRQHAGTLPSLPAPPAPPAPPDLPVRVQQAGRTAPAPRASEA